MWRQAVVSREGCRQAAAAPFRRGAAIQLLATCCERLGWTLTGLIILYGSSDGFCMLSLYSFTIPRTVDSSMAYSAPNLIRFIKIFDMRSAALFPTCFVASKACSGPSDHRARQPLTFLESRITAFPHRGPHVPATVRDPAGLVPHRSRRACPCHGVRDGERRITCRSLQRATTTKWSMASSPRFAKKLRETRPHAPNMLEQTFKIPARTKPSLWAPTKQSEAFIGCPGNVRAEKWTRERSASTAGGALQQT